MWVILLDLPAQCAWVRASSHSGKLWHERLTKSKIARGRKFNSKKSSLPCSREEREERERGGGDPSSTLRSPPPARRPTILSLTKVASAFPRKRRGFKSPRRQNYEWVPNATELDKQDRFRAIFFLQKNEWKRKKWCKFSNHDRMKKKFKWRPPFKNSSPQQLFKKFFQICSVTLSFDSIAQSTCLKRRGPGVEPRISLLLFTIYLLSSASDLSVTAPWPTVLSKKAGSEGLGLAGF